MKIGVKVSDIASLLGFNNFKTKDIVLKNIHNRLFKRFTLDNFNITPSNVEYIIDNMNVNIEDIQYEIIHEDIYLKEYNNFFIYCLKSEINRENGIIIDYKFRISQKVKNFIPIIDLIHCQFYMLLSNCRRCILNELWEDGFTRKKFIKINDLKIKENIQLLELICEKIILNIN